MRDRALVWSLGPLLLVALVWMGPLLAGHMPVTADHTVHLSRAQAYCEVLGQGQLRGWSQMWGFGVPLGELYPVLGDLGYCAARALGAPVQRAYAWTFALVMLLGIVAQYCLGRSMLRGQGPKIAALAGVLAALMWSLDLGAYREGGWNYTVLFGVWPQSLATSLSWLALLALHRAVREPQRWRGAALLVGAALLAHPMALLHLAIGGVIWALSQRGPLSAGRALFCVAVGGGLAAWWWLPMLEHRAFMANYGWLSRSTSALLRAWSKGHFAQAMPSVVGYAGLVGLGACVCAKDRWPRVVAACALVLWLATSRTLFADLRLDLWASAFTHLQFQRFVISAKPALFALAALGLCLPVMALARIPRAPFRQKSLYFIVALLCLGASLHKLPEDFSETRAQAKQLDWGRWPLARLGQAFPDFDSSYAQFVAWARDQDPPLHLHAKDGRNLHWFMDLPALTGHRVYKSGFTPGDNFRHKPESRDRALLSRLPLTHELTRVPSDSPLRDGTLRWGAIELRPLPVQAAAPVVHDAQGQEIPALTWLSQPAPNRWRLEIPEDQPGPLTVALPLAHYARWEVRHQEHALPTFATPAQGPFAGRATAPATTPPGRALGNEGRAPTLLSFEAPGPGVCIIEYIPTRSGDLWALGISLLCAGLLAFKRIPRLPKCRLDRLAALGLGLALIAGAFRVRSTWTQQRAHWVRRFDHEDTQARRIRPGFIKSNMVIERALIARPKQDDPATLELVASDFGPSLRLWWSLDDDRAQRPPRPRPRYEIRVWLNKDPSDPPDLQKSFTHRPDRHQVQLDTRALVGKRATIRVEIHSDRPKRTRIGVNAYPETAPKEPG